MRLPWPNGTAHVTRGRLLACACLVVGALSVPPPSTAAGSAFVIVRGTILGKTPRSIDVQVGTGAARMDQRFEMSVQPRVLVAVRAARASARGQHPSPLSLAAISSSAANRPVRLAPGAPAVTLEPGSVTDLLTDRTVVIVARKPGVNEEDVAEAIIVGPDAPAP